MRDRSTTQDQRILGPVVTKHLVFSARACVVRQFRLAMTEPRSTGPRHLAVLQFKITLREVTPAVWRRIQIPAEGTFWDLHVAIQDAMGWTDSHLHAFQFAERPRNEQIGIPTEDDLDAGVHVRAGWKVKVSKLLRKPGDEVVYLYDFGDDWTHDVLLEGLLLPESRVSYPRCLDGARRCPPEDCGGPDGYERFLEEIADPRHPEHTSSLVWVGGSFDAEAFDPSAVVFEDPAERWKVAFEPDPRRAGR